MRVELKRAPLAFTRSAARRDPHSSPSALPTHSASQQNRALRGLSFDRRVGAQLDALKGSLDFRYPHLGFNRVGNETILMGGVMHLIELFRTGLSVVAPRNPWT